MQHCQSTRAAGAFDVGSIVSCTRTIRVCLADAG